MRTWQYKHILTFLALVAKLKGEVNLARGKPTNASSPTPATKSGVLVDGNRDPNFRAGSCFNTMLDPKPLWWMVDLGMQYTIVKVLITNRSDCCASRSHHFVIEVFEENPATSSGVFCHYHEPELPSGATETMPCQAPVVGRFVRLLKNLTLSAGDVINICEVEVYGGKAPLQKMVMSSKKDRKMIGGNSISVANRADCALLCFHDFMCLNFNYKEGMCELVEGTKTTVGAAGWNLSTMLDSAICPK